MPRKRKESNQKDINKKVQFSDGKSKKEKNPPIEELLGFKQQNHFGTTNASEFDAKLETMGLSELQTMAVNASVFPSGTKVSLKNKLKKAFKQFLALNGRTPVPQASKAAIDPNSDAAKKFLEIMNG